MLIKLMASDDSICRPITGFNLSCDLPPLLPKCLFLKMSQLYSDFLV